MATNNFLADYQNILIRHLIMPGSHDAGLADASFAAKGLGAPKAQTVTQSVGVGEQANYGSRFFDVRIIKSGGSLKSYHSPGDTRIVGGVGQGFETILNELRDFVRGHPTEFVIVRLSHIKDSAEVFEALQGWMGRDRNGDLVYKGTGNLATKFVRELAGRIVFVIDAKKMVVGKFNTKDEISSAKKSGAGLKLPGQTDGFHRLYQNKAGKPLPDVFDGLCVCGEFSSSNKLETIVAKQASNYSEHDQHRTHGDNKYHLYCLYWTSTGGNIQENTAQLTANFKRVRDMVADKNAGTVKHCVDQGIPLVNTSAWSNALGVEDAARRRYAVYSCSLPNIILYDFVNEETSKSIIGLNGLTLCLT